MDLNEVMAEFARLRQEHTHDRDRSNNYACFNIEACTGCNFVFNSRSCISCHDLDGCIECVQCVECKHCAFCVGLKGAEYHILNKPVPYDEYHARLKELGIDPEVMNL